jgi:hypothetical protein
MSDLLWRDTSGNTAMWFMNGTTIASTAGIGNIQITCEKFGYRKQTSAWTEANRRIAVGICKSAIQSHPG